MKTLKSILPLILMPFFVFAQYTGGNGDGFAVWTSQSDISLPVELISYNSVMTDNSINLEWETASESENVGFIIKRKVVHNDIFATIDSYNLNDNLKGLGNSSIGKQYSFKDSEVSFGNEYVYQVISVSSTGLQKVIIQTDILNYQKENIDSPTGFVLKQNYPNPFNPSTMISFTTEKERHVKISIYSINGSLVEVLTDRNYSSGKYEITYNPQQKLSSNIYICRVVSGETIKYLKMTYLK